MVKHWSHYNNYNSKYTGRTSNIGQHELGYPRGNPLETPFYQGQAQENERLFNLNQMSFVTQNTLDNGSFSNKIERIYLPDGKVTKSYGGMHAVVNSDILNPRILQAKKERQEASSLVNSLLDIYDDKLIDGLFAGRSITFENFEITGLISNFPSGQRLSYYFNETRKQQIGSLKRGQCVDCLIRMIMSLPISFTSRIVKTKKDLIKQPAIINGEQKND